MRILFRVLGLSIIALLFITMFMELISYNVRFDELNTISSLAMTNTQILMEENIEDKYYGTNNARSHFMSNQEYINSYLDNLKTLISTNSQYEVEVIGVDSKRGMLDVIVKCHYKQFNGKIKTLEQRKTSVIDVNVNEV